MLTLQDILEIENTLEILDFVCPNTDYLLWPRIRATIIRMVIDRELYGQETLIKAGSRILPGKVLQCFAEGVIHNLKYLNKSAKIVFFTTGLTNIKLGNSYFNRVSDYFSLCFPDSTLLIEDAFEWQYLKPRANKNVMYHTPYVLSAAFRARLPLKRIKEHNILEFIKFIETRLQKIIKFQFAKTQKEFLHKLLLGYCQSLEFQLAMYEKLYQQLKPELIFFEDGCYGYRSHLIRLAKEMGIKTAEQQHGLVSAGHDAYNYAPMLLHSSSYQKYVPDFFLAYGQWWADRINPPLEIKIIGNPHRETMAQKYKPVALNKHKILLLSDGVRFHVYFEMAKSLKKKIGNEYEILVRPHPMERKVTIERYAKNDEGIEVDSSENLYERLAETYAVIGEMSTALFEAVGLADKIFVKNHPITKFSLPDCPFDQFDDVEQLTAKLSLDNSGGVSGIATASIWAEAWENNYREFITKSIGLKS